MKSIDRQTLSKMENERFGLMPRLGAAAILLTVTFMGADAVSRANIPNEVAEFITGEDIPSYQDEQ